MAEKEKVEPINFEVVSFEIISKVAEGKAIALEALKLAKESKIKEAREKLKLAEKAIGEAGSKHMDVIVQEAQGIKHPFYVLFMHAEDQFLTTQTMLLLVGELIDMYEKFGK